MNLLGKIFIVLIFLLSVIFMSFVFVVYATHTNWKAEATALKTKVDAAQNFNRELKDNLENAQKAVTAAEDAKRQALAKLETECDELRRERERLQVELADLQKDAREAVAAMEASQTSQKTLRTEVETLRSKIDVAQNERRKAFDQVVDFTDQLHQALNELTTLKSRNMQISQQIADAKQVLGKFGLEAVPAKYQGVPPEGLKGEIRALKSTGLVEVNLGSDDGIQKGHKLEVYRMSADQAKYLGRIQIIEVHPDKAVGKILPEFQKGNFEIGDQIASKLD